MGKKVIFVLCICFTVFSIFACSDGKNPISSTIIHDENNMLTTGDVNSIERYKDELIIELKKEVESLQRDNKYLMRELVTVKDKLAYKEENPYVKFYGHTIEFSQAKRQHFKFNEDLWEDGKNFKADGKVYLQGIGFNRMHNNNNSYSVAKLYNEGKGYTKLTAYIGVDDLAKDLLDSEITFTIYNNDKISK